jgi:hypothetical protein
MQKQKEILTCMNQSLEMNQKYVWQGKPVDEEFYKLISLSDIYQIFYNLIFSSYMIIFNIFIKEIISTKTQNFRYFSY